MKGYSRKTTAGGVEDSRTIPISLKPRPAPDGWISITDGNRSANNGLIPNLKLKRAGRGLLVSRLLRGPIVTALLAGCLPLTGVAQAESHAGSWITLDARVKYNISSRLEILEDRESALTIHDVSSGPWSRSFKKAAASHAPNLGITRSAIWARFTVRNPFERVRRMLVSFDYPLADSVSFFSPKGPDEFSKIDAGHAVPVDEKMIPHRYYIFPLEIPARESLTCYIRVKSGANMILPLTLWMPSALDRQDHRDQMVFGIVFGVMFAFIAYFAALSLKLRNPASMWFTFYISLLGLLMASYQGYLQSLLRPDLAGLNRILLITIIGLLYFTGAKFLRVFLNTHIYSRFIDNIIRALQWMGVFFIPMNIFVNPVTPLFGIVIAGLGPLFSSTVAIIYWKRGVPNAKYFAVGWLIGHLTSVADLLRIFGIIPYMPVMMYLLPAAILSSIIFFSIAIMEQSREYRYYASIDGLTGLANRRHFNQVLEMEWKRCMRNKVPLSVLMVDIDFFKAFNDSYGHKAGDDCLVAIGGVLKKSARRAADLAGRYGGEEFIVLLPETRSEKAAMIAEEMRLSAEALGIRHAASGTADVVTISVGTATMTPRGKNSPAKLIKNADEALYRAKKAGRNRVVTA